MKTGRAQSILLVFFLIVSTGCAATMAAKQPEYTDLSMLRQGISRSEVVSVLGRPLISDTNKDGHLVETYKFRQGYRTVTRVVRVMFHVAADFFTLFLWEFVGMPMEVVFAGNETTVEVTYDENKQFKEAIVLKKEVP